MNENGNETSCFAGGRISRIQNPKIEHRGGSRIFHRRGRQPLERVRQLHIFYIFFKKTDEIKDSLVRRGERRSAPLFLPLNIGYQIRIKGSFGCQFWSAILQYPISPLWWWEQKQKSAIQNFKTHIKVHEVFSSRLWQVRYLDWMMKP